MGVRSTIKSLLGVSAYAADPARDPSLGSPVVEKRLAVRRGQLSPLPTTRLRWLFSDIEAAVYAADSGDLSFAAQIMAAADGDGVLRGVESARITGVTKLPKIWSGDEEQIAALTLRDGSRSVFDAMFPAVEVRAMARDGLRFGVSVGQLVPVEGRDYPILIRLDPEWLRYRRFENRWYYQSTVGLLPITPGDGKWILHIEGGRTNPWRHGLWYPLANAWLAKASAEMAKYNWENKLANPARIAIAPAGATDGQIERWFAKVAAWAINPVFAMRPGYEVKLLESNGRGYESFNLTADRSDQKYMIAVLGQVGTTTSSGAFASSDVHADVRADFIASTAEAIAHTLNTQGIPPWIVSRWGEEGLARAATFEYDVTPPSDLAKRAQALGVLGPAVAAADAALAPSGQRIDAAAEYRRFGVAVVSTAPPAVAPPAESADGAELVDDAPELPPLADDEPLEPEAAEVLADDMTRHGVDRCEHGRPNRCPLCGVERTRQLVPGKTPGSHSWRIGWRAIDTSQDVSEAAE